MSLQQAYKNDPDKEVGGVWLEYKGGIGLLMRRAGGLNVSYDKTLQRKVKPHQRKFQNDELSDDLSDRLLAETYAETIVLDWRTKQADGSYVETLEWDGAHHKYDKALMVKVLVALPDFFNAVRRDAQERAHFTAEGKEGDAKN